MRSNIARTWPSSRVPVLGAATLGCAAAGLRVATPLGLALELAEERDQVSFLLLGQVAVGGHRWRRVLERPRDRRLGQDAADVGQLRPWPVVAVLSDLVAGQAARLGGHQLAGLVLLGDLQVDLVR